MQVWLGFKVIIKAKTKFYIIIIIIMLQLLPWAVKNYPGKKDINSIGMEANKSGGELF